MCLTLLRKQRYSEMAFAGKLWSVEKLFTAAMKRVWNHLAKTRVTHPFIGDQFVSNVFNALRYSTFHATSSECQSVF